MNQTLTQSTLVGRSRRSVAAAPWLSGGALWLAAGLLHDPAGWRFDTASILWLAADAVLLVGILGLLRRRLHGTSRLGTAALAGALVARVAFAAGEVATLVQGHDDNPFIPIGAMLTAVTMTVYGVIVLRRRTVAGAVRFAFLAMGLYPFLVMFPALAASGGEPNMVLVGLWGVPTALVGLAASSTDR